MTTYAVYFGAKQIGTVQAYAYTKALAKAREKFGPHVSISSVK